MIFNLKVKNEVREKKGFYPTDFLKPNFDLYQRFKDVPPTNPPKWNETLKFGAGNGMEAQLLTILKNSDIVKEDYDQKEHGRVLMNRNDIEIRGYIDAINIQGEPIEIKSINNKNQYDIMKYRKGEPRANYVGQLAIYMDFLNKDKGYLFVASIDGLNYFIIPCNRVGLRKFRCGQIEVDIDKEYKRWSKLFKNNVLKDIEPDCWEYHYKYPIDEIDWKSVSKASISRARNNKAVIGDWQVQYSEYKDLIIERQGVGVGYSPEEITKIKEYTNGYTTWK